MLDDGHAVTLPAAKPRSVLALLLLRANELVSSDRLVDELWGSAAPATSANVVQGYVSKLRKALPGGSHVLVTRPPGYLLVVAPGALDLERFHRLATEGRALLEAGDARGAGERLREALGLWRGTPLADLEHEPFARHVIANLEEVRLDVLEARIGADLATGRGADLVPELRELVSSHPFREHLRGHLMLALYRSERQAEALEVYADARRLLASELGLEPSPSLRRLQRAILEQDHSVLGASAQERPTDPVAGEGSILVHMRELDALPVVMPMVAALAATEPTHEVVVVNIAVPEQLEAATATLARVRDGPAPAVRVAAFSSSAPTEDVLRLALRQAVDFIVEDVGPDVLEPGVVDILGAAPCDVALVLRRGGALRGGEILVPFGGGDHDWAALELGAWLGRATGATLRLLGAAGEGRAAADASRLLADASLVLQRATGIVAVPLLSPSGSRGIAAAAADTAGLLVLGLSERWRDEGLGRTRASLCAEPPCPVVVTHRGARTGLLRPPSMSSRFPWSVTRPRPVL